MKGLNKLNILWEKKGRDFVDSLFNQYVTITEKIHGIRIQFEIVGDSIKFYNKDSKNPINKIDKTLNKMYAEPIAYIKSLDESIIKKLPKGYRFGFEYIPEKDFPGKITYDNLPKNKLMLTDVTKRNDGKIIENIDDSGLLREYADILNVSPPPIIFEGRLNDEQKEKIIQFIETPHNKLISKCKTNSFSTFVVSVLNPNSQKMSLNLNLSNIIEGIVFRFKNSEDDSVYLAKMLDPIFEEKCKQNEESSPSLNHSHIYELTFIDIVYYFWTIPFDEFETKSSKYDEIYVELISWAFNKFINIYGSKYKGVDFGKPEFMKHKNFDVNLNEVTNKSTRNWIEKSIVYKDIFQIMLNMFRKKKKYKKSYSFITQDTIRSINQLINKINGIIESIATIEEAYQYVLDHYSVEELDDFDVIGHLRNVDNEDDKSNTDVEPSDKDDKDKDKDDKDKDDDDKDKDDDLLFDDAKSVNIIIGRFQPFHKGHYNVIEKAYENNGLPSVIVSVGLGKPHNPISPKVYKDMMRDLVEGANGRIVDVVYVDTGYLPDIYDLLRPKYEPKAILCGSDRKKDWERQMESIREEYKISDDVVVISVDREDSEYSGTLVRESIKNKDYGKFQELMLPYLHPYYHRLRKSSSFV